MAMTEKHSAQEQPEHDLLQEIPSPSTRLWVGLFVILSIFLVFAVYTIHELRWLQDFQVNVVQKNRKASLQLLRLQNDAYLLAISMRDMALAEPQYPILDWRPEFARLRQDMNDAVKIEGQFAVSTPASDDKRARLRNALDSFAGDLDQVFALAQRGNEAAARQRIQTQLESKRAVITDIAARLLVANDQAQVEAAERITAVYGDVKRQVLIVVGSLFLLALATGLYTLQANRQTFARLHHLAERLQWQSEQLRQLSWKLIDVQEETLRHVARDLHDEFGQILTAVGMMLARVDQKVVGRDTELVKDLNMVKQIVEDTLRNIRDRSQIFRPAILDDFGLSQSLEWLVGQISKQTGIEVHFVGDISQGYCPCEDAIHLYRIVQESLSNVARHAKAREAWVTFRCSGGELNLEIRDDGVGFERGVDFNRAPGEGIGLMGMQERAQHLHGSLTVKSGREGGTVVSVRIPVRKPSVPPVAEKAG